MADTGAELAALRKQVEELSQDVNVHAGGIHVRNAPLANVLQALDDLSGARARTAEIETPQAQKAWILDGLVRQHAPVQIEHLRRGEGLFRRDSLVFHGR